MRSPNLQVPIHWLNLSPHPVRQITSNFKWSRPVGRRHDRRIEQLIGYSITGEGDRLDLLERFQGLERRVRKLEEK